MDSSGVVDDVGELEVMTLEDNDERKDTSKVRRVKKSKRKLKGESTHEGEGGNGESGDCSGSKVDGGRRNCDSSIESKKCMKESRMELGVDSDEDDRSSGMSNSSGDYYGFDDNDDDDPFDYTSNGNADTSNVGEDAGNGTHNSGNYTYYHDDCTGTLDENGRVPGAC